MVFSSQNLRRIGEFTIIADSLDPGDAVAESSVENYIVGRQHGRPLKTSAKLQLHSGYIVS